MKVLLITKTLAEFANIQGKIREIAKLGINLTVVSPPRWAGNENEIRGVRPEGYELLLSECCFSRTKSVRAGNHLHFYPDISSIIGREKWDLVHIDEEPFNLATYHVLAVCCRYGARAIFTTWQNLSKKYPLPFGFFERYVYQNAAGAIAGSAEALDILIRRGFRAFSVRIPQLGVDPTIFRRQGPSALRQTLASSSAFVVGFVGRIHPSKGLYTLVRSFSALPKNTVLVLAGRGPYRAELERLVLDLGLAGRVRWMPWVNSGNVTEYMNALDVLVLPSRTYRTWKEQFGRVLVEAMSCETCVIGSDSGDIPNVIGNAGLIFPEGDEISLTERLHQLLEDRSLREDLSRRGRQRVLEHFTYAKIAGDTVKFYQKICNGVGTSSKVSA